MLSPGPDNTLKTQDDIVSEVVIKVENGQTNIVIDNQPQRVPDQDAGEHICVFNRSVKNEQFIATRGNCITPTVYYYSCSCGLKGTSTFHGSLEIDNHFGEPRVEYQAFDANHNVLSYCSSCNVLISTVPEAHNMVGEECTLCHKIIHNHNYNLELVVEAAKASSATCTSKATYYYSCLCGALSTDTFEYGEVRAHTFTGNSTQYKASDATCSVRATYYKTCSSCGIQGSETFESGLADGPHPGTTVSNYEKSNETQHKVKNLCTACGHEMSSSLENHTTDDQNNCTKCKEHIHSYTIKHVDEKHLATPASCTAAAQYYYSCTCDENGVTTFNDGTPLSHNTFGTVADGKYLKSNATCLMPTIYYKSCTGCGLVSTETFTVGQALGHIENVINGYAATCTTDGLTDGITCSRCNEVVKMQVVIHAFGHTEITTHGIAATCTISGKTDKIACSTCNIVLTESTTIAALGHDIIYDEGYAATCSAPGFTTGERCSRCDYKVTQQEIPTLPHTEVIDNAVAVTCTTNGYTTGKHCSVCNTIIIPQEIIYATGHTEKVFDAVPPTCTQSGVTEGKTCSVCDVLLVAQISIPATGHTEVQDAAIAATCTQEGRTAGSHCSVCNTIISGTSIIEKIAHDYNIEITNSQCTVAGLIQYTCNLCGYTYSEEIAATGHIDNNLDNKCDICTSIINEIFFPTYALNGKWLFNAEPNISPIEGTLNTTDGTRSYYTTENISFVSNGQTFSGIVITYSERKNPPSPRLFKYFDLAYLSENQHQTTYSCNDGNIETYEWQERRIIDFGQSLQIVSEEFYNWFINNASPYVETSQELSGVWIFNNEIEFITIPEELINFKSNNMNFVSMSVDIESDYINTSGYLNYITQTPATLNSIQCACEYSYSLSDDDLDGPSPYALAPNDPTASGNSVYYWYNELFRTVDFGSDPQLVSASFYTWFTSNAVPANPQQAQCNHTTTNTIIRTATCTQSGIELRTCYICGTAQHIITPVLSHVLVDIPEVSPTCTASGTSHGLQCSVCNTYVIQPVTIAALGHNLQTQSTKNATCLEDGFVIDYCNRCDTTFETILKALGHVDYVKDGYCDNCNYQFTYQIEINKVLYTFTYGMTWREWVNSNYNYNKLIPFSDKIIFIDLTNNTVSCMYELVFKDNQYVATDMSWDDPMPMEKYMSITDTSLLILYTDDYRTTTLSHQGYETFDDIADGFKNGELSLVVYNNKAYYSYDDVISTIKSHVWINGSFAGTNELTYNRLYEDYIDIKPCDEDSVQFYYADENGNPIGDVLSNTYQLSLDKIGDDANIAYVVSYSVRLTYNDNYDNSPLANSEIKIYNEQGILINKVTTNNDGLAVIAGLTPGVYTCKSKYETVTVSIGLTISTEYNIQAQECVFTLKKTGYLTFYNDANNTQWQSKPGSTITAYLFPGTYRVQIDQQNSYSTVIVDENGSVTIK